MKSLQPLSKDSPFELFGTESSLEDRPCAVFLSSSGDSARNEPVRDKLSGRIGDSLNLLWFELALEPAKTDPAEIASRIARELERIPGKISVISHGPAASVCHALVARVGFPIHRVVFISPMASAADPDFSTYRQVPMLIVQGTHDSVAPWGEHGRKLLEGSADVTVEFVPSAGHWPHLESERVSWQAVIGFLRDEYPVFVSDEDSGTQVIEIP